MSNVEISAHLMVIGLWLIRRCFGELFIRLRIINNLAPPKTRIYHQSTSGIRILPVSVKLVNIDTLTDIIIPGLTLYLYVPSDAGWVCLYSHQITVETVCGKGLNDKNKKMHFTRTLSPKKQNNL